ncbi:MFS transporter [Brevibacillus humidisoli]|uniref:MFS transporter n=1 Tax=Brevibacillus humidisoli TaxID=2895522 RepID=UPI001E5734DB|nr:MFS transporter [Brevibacillus humidisoli]UFJ39291.1 MFS transporter [Brevibacillus humidisoli]
MDDSIPQQNGEKLILVLAFTLAVSFMSATMFNIVLTEIRSEFHLTFAQVSWVSTVYLLIYAIGTVLYGKLADSFKLKNLVTFGLCFFAAGSLVGLIAQAYWMVLLGRILQASGAAVVPAIASIIPVRYFPPERRGHAIGISMTGLSIGNVLGPVVASGVVSILDWRWLFCMPLFTLFTLNQLDPGLVGFVMVPAALASALLGKKAGKWADAKGNSFLVYTSFILLFACFVFLSTFAGASPWFVMCFLVIGIVGQTFMFIALSNTISQTLPKEQVGIGMGLLSMLNFLAGAISASVYGRIIDLDTVAHWNPMNTSPVATVYSNLYLVLAVVPVVIVLLYYSRFGKRTAEKLAKQAITKEM